MIKPKIQQTALMETRAHRRFIKHHTRFDVEVFSVYRDIYQLLNGNLTHIASEPMSPWFGSKFTSLKALRKIRKAHPTARLVRETMYFGADDLAKRAVFMCLVVNAGERP